MSEFFAMGGYGLYVWGSYGLTALVIAVEVISVRARRRAAIGQAQLTTPDNAAAATGGVL